MVAINRMRIGAYEFAIEAASFRYIIQSWSGPGWDFNFNGPCITNEAKRLFPYGARLYTEAAPLPLQRAEDYTGTELVLPLPYDEISGEALFGLEVWEEHDVSDLQLRFVERHRNSYRIEILATVAPTVLGHPEQLQLSAWVAQLPDHAYPV
jgi:hypothetical protein